VVMTSVERVGAAGGGAAKRGPEEGIQRQKNALWEGLRSKLSQREGGLNPGDKKTYTKRVTSIKRFSAARWACVHQVNHRGDGGKKKGDMKMVIISLQAKVEDLWSATVLGTNQTMHEGTKIVAGLPEGLGMGQTNSTMGRSREVLEGPAKKRSGNRAEKPPKTEAAQRRAIEYGAGNPKDFCQRGGGGGGYQGEGTMGGHLW